MSHKAVFGIVNNYTAAESIVQDLQAAGFASGQISVLFPDNEDLQDIGHVKTSKAPEGAATGAATGGVVGGVVGLLAGIGALAIPGIGPFIAAGPIMAALSGAAVGAGTGGLVGGLIGLGIPEIEAKIYEEKLKTGNYLVSVHAHDSKQEDLAEKVFKDAGADHVTSTATAKAPSA